MYTIFNKKEAMNINERKKTLWEILEEKKWTGKLYIYIRILKTKEIKRKRLAYKYVISLIGTISNRIN